MLNIEDIKEKLARSPEPKEVGEIRAHIIETFNKLEFEEGPHKYYLPRADGTKEELISVSAMTHLFEPETDWDKIRANYARKNGMTEEAVKRMWRENNIRATNAGTGTHLFGEMYMHFILGNDDQICDVVRPQYEDGYLIPHSPKETAIEAYYKDIFDTKNIYPVMPETRVYIGINDKYPLKTKFAGTFDILHCYKAHDGKWKLLIHDFKTNNDIYSSYNAYKGNMMKEPFGDLIDEPKGHYTLQLSAYQLCLQQLGYEIADRKLIWLKDDASYERVSLPDVTDRIINALS